MLVSHGETTHLELGWCQASRGISLKCTNVRSGSRAVTGSRLAPLGTNLQCESHLPVSEDVTRACGVQVRNCFVNERAKVARYHLSKVDLPCCPVGGDLKHRLHAKNCFR